METKTSVIWDNFFTNSFAPLYIKENLNKTYGASVCDMECAGVLLTSLNAGIPTLIIKAVSDGKGGADEFNRRVNTSAKVYIDMVNKLVEVI